MCKIFSREYCIDKFSMKIEGSNNYFLWLFWIYPCWRHEFWINVSLTHANSKLIIITLNIYQIVPFSLQCRSVAYNRQKPDHVHCDLFFLRILLHVDYDHDVTTKVYVDICDFHMSKHLCQCRLEQHMMWVISPDRVQLKDLLTKACDNKLIFHKQLKILCKSISQQR